jgi:glycosyltransferase involved in cell wall biosynthesis
LTDGVCNFPVHTLLDDQQLEPIVQATGQPVAATAPVVVFGNDDEIATAGLEYPQACLVWSGLIRDPRELLRGLAEACRGMGSENPQPSLGEHVLDPFVELGPADPTAPLLHISSDVSMDGTDVLVRMYARELIGLGTLTILVAQRDVELEATLLRLARENAAEGVEVRISFAEGPLQADHLRDASAVIWPLRVLREPALLLKLMASGRPLVVSRNRHTAVVLSAPGICRAIGGRHLPAASGSPPFEPDPRTLVDGVRSVVEGWHDSLAMAQRARNHVLTHHVSPRPSRPSPAAVDSRPLVVLEAPLFEVSSTATLTIETARALHRRGRVNLRLVPRLPFRSDVNHLRQSAPSLLPLLSRNPARADLWLSAGWPPRADRPEARCFGLRLDWEYGALPAELSPLVSQEADLIVVHSAAVQRAVAASGRPADSIALIPHGVDGSVFREDGDSCPEVLAFKGNRPAILFVGGLIWRKGIDLFLKAVAEVQRSVGVCAVVKPLGAASHYRSHNLEGLVRKFSKTPGAPDLLILDREMDRNELAGMFRACDLLLHPYRGEGFGMPVLEALACGLPVMVSSGGSTDDFCDNRSAVRIPTRRHFPRMRGAYEFRPHVLEPDSSALVSQLTQTLQRLAGVRQVARAVAGEVRARYTWDLAAESLERLAFGIAARPADKSIQPQSYSRTVSTMP